MTRIEDITHDLLAEYAGKFFRLVADHGEFQVKQLREYCSLQLRVRLDENHNDELVRIAESRGAVRDKLVPGLMRLPVKKRKGLPSGKNDKHTIDMFGKPAKR